MDLFSSFALIALGRFRFQKIVDLVLEPCNRIFADIDVQREFFGRLEPGNMYA